MSAEAHTLLQLLQGIDTGTSVLPPNALRLCFSPADEPPTALGSEDVALDSVRVSKAPKDAALDDDDQSSSPRCDPTVAAEKAPALAAALEKLGIFATAEESAKLLVDYADSDGTFDRYAFSLALEAARRAMKPPQTVSTTLVATDGREVLASPFTSLALALRYPRTTISIEDDVFESDDAVDAQDARTIFPLLQTVEDLKVDAARIAAQSARLFEETL